MPAGLERVLFNGRTLGMNNYKQNRQKAILGSLPYIDESLRALWAISQKLSPLSTSHRSGTVYPLPGIMLTRLEFFAGRWQRGAKHAGGSFEAFQPKELFEFSRNDSITYYSLVDIVFVVCISGL